MFVEKLKIDEMTPKEQKLVNHIDHLIKDFADSKGDIKHWKSRIIAERIVDKCFLKNTNDKEMLCDFFKYFRDNGEANIGMSIEQFVDGFLASRQ